MSGADDEVARVAESHASLYGANAVSVIDANIARSLADQDWGKVNLWHRVRLRLIRLARIGAARQAIRPPARLDQVPIHRASESDPLAY